MVWGSRPPNLVVIGAVVAEILDGEGFDRPWLFRFWKNDESDKGTALP